MRFAVMWAACALALGGCTTTTISSYPAVTDKPKPRAILVVIDGTGNDQTSRTNAARLYELAVNQDRPNLAVFYTEGVGTDGRVIGAVTGWGIGHDVRRAYRFIANEWTPGTQIYLAGFSRGTYAARILAGLIYSAGIADVSGRDNQQQRQLIGRLYDAYKMDRKKGETAKEQDDRRRKAIAQVAGFRPQTPELVRVTAMALWDTVEALAAPDGKDDMFEENRRYADQLCNVDHAFHALALDDNRAYSFTPLSLVSDNRRAICPEDAASRPLESFVDEVWFAGAHADVGGSYADGNGKLDGYLSGLSMNWMLARLAPFKFLPRHSRQFGEPLGVIHNAKLWTKLYKPLERRDRNPFRFAENREVTRYNGNKPRVHISFEQRLATFKTLDALHSPRCEAGRPLAQSLLCHDDIKAMPFVATLLKRDCVEETATGYRLRDRQQPVPGKREIETRCVTLVTDRSAS